VSFICQKKKNLFFIKILIYGNNDNILNKNNNQIMGIKNLHQFLRKACPLIYSEIHLSRYAYKKIAIDTSIYMCKFKTSYGKQWLDAFLLLVTVLRENEIHPVFVYDTKFPVEKDQEKKNRTLARIKTKERVEKISTDWDAYKASFSSEVFATGVLPHLPENMSVELTDFLGKTERTSLVVIDVDREMDHLQNTLLSIRTEDFDLTRELLTLLGVAWLNATGEAEATCAVLCRTGLVDAVLSEDTDVLNYCATRFLHRLNIHGQTAMEIDYHELLVRLDFTADQFLDFCIMCGTDYNTNLFKIGPEKSYRLLKKHGRIEQIHEQYPGIDMSAFPFPRVREIFVDDQSLTEEQTGAALYSAVPNTHRLSEFCFVNNCRFDLQRLVHAFTTNPQIVFQDSTLAT